MSAWPQTPARDASFMELDRWLLARGWERDRVALVGALPDDDEWPVTGGGHE